MLFIDSLVPEKYRKWLTLAGGFLIHFTMGTLYATSNLLPYMIVNFFVYLKKYT